MQFYTNNHSKFCRVSVWLILRRLYFGFQWITSLSIISLSFIQPMANLCVLLWNRVSKALWKSTNIKHKRIFNYMYCSNIIPSVIHFAYFWVQMRAQCRLSFCEIFFFMRYELICRIHKKKIENGEEECKRVMSSIILYYSQSHFSIIFFCINNTY